MGFDAPIPTDGYAWWYIDGLSADGQAGITIIGFIGSVFSPYYAWARRWGGANPLGHCALNVAVYSQGRNRWAMTERGCNDIARDTRSLSIGPSAMAWDGTVLTIDIDERTAPLPSRIRGRVRLRPEALSTRTFELDSHGQHRWRPAAPCSTIEVELDEPAVCWRGAAYFDINMGDAPLESAFSHWDWSRAVVPGGTAILYDVSRHDGPDLSIAMHVDRTGRAQDIECPPAVALPRSLWRMRRTTRVDPGYLPKAIRSFEDAPFYARTLVASHLMGAPVTAIHESLSLDRFRAPLVQAMLPFRMPRFAR